MASTPADDQIAFTDVRVGTDAHVLLLAAAESVDALRAGLERVCSGDSPASGSDSSRLNQVRAPYRLAAIARSASEAAGSLLARCDPATFDKPPPGAVSPVFLFTGQGSQYVGMGRGLYEHHAPFRSCMNACSALFRPFLTAPLVAVLYSDEIDPEELNATRYAQPGIFALEVALARLWIAAGVEPSVLVGHSIGELAAAHIAGVLELDAAVQLVGTRANLMNAMPRCGAMLSTTASEAAVLERICALGLALEVAAVNGRESTVVSGNVEHMDVLVADLENAGVECRALTVSHAFHSALMEPMLEPFEAAIRDLTYHAPTRPVASNVTGALMTPDRTPDATYYRAHVRKTVRFSDCLDTAEKMGSDIYLEVGPQATLSAIARRHLGRGDRAWLASLRCEEDAVLSCVKAATKLFERGANLRWDQLPVGL